MTNRKNLPYYIFTLIVIFLAALFFNSRKIFGDDRKLMNENYDVTYRTMLGGYNFKVTNARIDKATNTMYIDFFIKGAEDPREDPPELYNVTNGKITGDKLSFKVEKNTDREYANLITVSKVPKKFDFIRLYIRSKGFDVKNEDTIDEFGNVIKHKDTPGKVSDIWVAIDSRTVKYYDSSKGEKPPTLDSAVNIDKAEKVVEEHKPEKETSVTTIPSVTTNSKVTTGKQPYQTTTTGNKHSHGTIGTQGTTTQSGNKPATTITAPRQQTVTPPTTTGNIKIHTISLSSDYQYNNIVLSVSKTAKLTPVILPASATNKNVIWGSSKPGIVSINSNGIVTALSSGKSIITVKTTDGSNLSASCMVTVN